MPKENYFLRFEDHTALKHLLLQSYLKRWATILLQKFERVWFVDAFAGAGADGAGTPGSPALAAEIARKVNEERPRRRMSVLAIEQHRGRFEALQRNLASYSSSFVHVRHGTLEERIDKFLGYVKNDPTLYFLDPFGVDGLDRKVIEKALSRKHSELLVLFSDEGAVRLLGKARAVPPSLADALAKVRSQASLLGADFDAEAEARKREEVEQCLRGHQSSGRALEILVKTFGGDWWAKEIDETPVELRQRRFVELYEDRVLRESGAKSVLRFEVATSNGRHKYFLLHAAKAPAAFAAMKEAIAATRKSVGKGDQRTFDAEFLGADVHAVADALVERFGGRTVRWTGVGREESIMRYLQYSSPLYPDQFQQIKASLIDRGLALTKPNGRLELPHQFRF